MAKHPVNNHSTSRSEKEVLNEKSTAKSKRVLNEEDYMVFNNCAEFANYFNSVMAAFTGYRLISITNAKAKPFNEDGKVKYEYKDYIKWSIDTEFKMPNRFKVLTANFPQSDLDNLWEALKIHEQGHVDICKKYLIEINNRKMPVEAIFYTQEEGRRIIKDKLDIEQLKCEKELNQKQLEYDNLTNNGRSQSKYNINQKDVVFTCTEHIIEGILPK